MRTKATKCKICNRSDVKLHGRICHSCDYKRNKEWFKKRQIRRKEEGYYKDYFRRTSCQRKRYSFLAKEHYGLTCMDCGYKKEPKILQVHHKDRDRKNNDLKNLIVLCPNCHMIRHLKTKTGIFTNHF